VAKRSPILGYNHNVRHRGLLFHVQTEDSGVDNPHIYTHLFNGGVIISSRKLQYDRGSAEEVVKALMQAQHKATLKELKAGIFDDKITSYFGDRPDLLDPAPRSRGRDTHESMTPPPHGLAASTPPRPNPPAPPPLTPVGLTGARADPILAARAAQVRDHGPLVTAARLDPNALDPMAPQPGRQGAVAISAVVDLQLIRTSIDRHIELTFAGVDTGTNYAMFAHLRRPSLACEP